ncbi:hypothetical protein SAY86_025824 [Trapa natans]|uniref:Protein MIZU-KUSSEI 1 n=1 Tax=Trapa natans TaxID=22666 RepID=A0AAN7QE01_TRANT|nr:hypothetical protein SAY86_025824 [Trapa natans]
MKSILAKSPHDSSFSFSRRFSWRKKVVEDEYGDTTKEEEDEEEIIRSIQQEREEEHGFHANAVPEFRSASVKQKKKKKKKNKRQLPQLAVSKLFSALASLGRGVGGAVHHRSGHASWVVGTLFGYRRGHVHFAVQSDARAGPEFLIQLAAPTSILVREMASGLVRIALECEKKKVPSPKKAAGKLLEEPVWNVYCNGRRCGFGLRRDYGPEEARILWALEPVSVGAGVLPGDGPARGELMYMRAQFERVIGSRDSQTFHMINPDACGGPELSFYLLRV